MKIAIDLDEVLAEFMVGFLKWWNYEYDDDLKFDEVHDYHFENFTNISTEELNKRLYRFYQTDFYINALVVAGAQKVVAELAKNHELHLVTARQEANREVTMQWLDKHFPKMFEEVTLLNHYDKDGGSSMNKGEICVKWGCEVIIDDNPHNVQSLVDNGVELIVFNKPWNSYLRMPPQVKRCDNWEEILVTINEMAKQNV